MTQQPVGPLGSDVAVTHILVVADPARSRDFWVDVLGAELYREYGGTSVVLRFAGTWLLLVSGGGPTADKPTVVFAPPADADRVSHAMTLRVADCQAAYQALRSRGAAFLTAPHDWGSEVRCFLRDPDGHLVETQPVEGHLTAAEPDITRIVISCIRTHFLVAPSEDCHSLKSGAILPVPSSGIVRLHCSLITSHHVLRGLEDRF